MSSISILKGSSRQKRHASIRMDMSHKKIGVGYALSLKISTLRGGLRRTLLLEYSSHINIRAWLKSSLCHNDDDDDDEEELFHETHLPAASNPPTEELCKEMDELRAMVNNQWAGADMINSILQDQQERLRQVRGEGLQ
ncbi:hypothetical protein Pint_15205 [Pistacia integerrima]|uniref:Uncharacterized protein n=1 Tax=Pistacia integerrima TaxID=434235 RepID=A0ACC0ZBS0_9ROSI|nr:hypothetical protein Pint_15205 [Pistacia integerrima]